MHSLDWPTMLHHHCSTLIVVVRLIILACLPPQPTQEQREWHMDLGHKLGRAVVLKHMPHRFWQIRTVVRLRILRKFFLVLAQFLLATMVSMKAAVTITTLAVMLALGR